MGVDEEKLLVGKDTGQMLPLVEFFVWVRPFTQHHPSNLVLITLLHKLLLFPIIFWVNVSLNHSFYLIECHNWLQRPQLNLVRLL